MRKKRRRRLTGRKNGKYGGGGKEDNMRMTRADTASSPLLLLSLSASNSRHHSHTHRLSVRVHEQRRAIPSFLQRGMELVERQQVLVLVLVSRRRGRDSAVFVGLKKR